MNKQKYIPFIVVASLLFGIIAQAQSVFPTASPTPSSTSGIKETLKTKTQDLKDKKAAAAAKKEEINKRMGEEIKKFWQNSVHRVEGLLRNESKLSIELDRKINRLAAAGKDTSVAKAKLDDAKQLATDVKQAIIDGNKAVEDALSSMTNPKDALAKVKDIVQGIMDKIKTLHQSLVDVRKAIGDLNPHSSTSPSPSASPSPSPSVTPVPTTS